MCRSKQSRPVLGLQSTTLRLDGRALVHPSQKKHAGLLQIEHFRAWFLFLWWTSGVSALAMDLRGCLPEDDDDEDDDRGGGVHVTSSSCGAPTHTHQYSASAHASMQILFRAGSAMPMQILFRARSAVPI